MTSVTKPLAEKLALVTGASRGIGAATAIALAAKGRSEEHTSELQSH